MENITQSSLKQVYQGVIIYIIVSLCGGIVSAIASIMAMGSVAVGSAGGLGLAAILSIGVYAVMVLGLIVYILGLIKFGPTLDTIGQNAIKKVLLGLILTAGACLLSMIPLMGMIGGIVNLVAFIVTLIGFSELRKSDSLNGLGKEGAQKLYNAMILSLIAGICVFIPVLGWIAAFVLNIMYYVYLASGWGKIRKSFE